MLLAVLVLVLVYAWHDFTRRAARTAWREPLDVGIVLLTLESEPVPDADLIALQQRVSALEQTLSAEFARYRDAPQAMFQLSVFGPLQVATAPPQPEGGSVWALLRHNYQLWRYTRSVDAAAAVPARAMESRIYVLVLPVKDQFQFVEGFSQQGGHLGIARVQVDESTADLALFVVAHELLHTLGASDKYDSAGEAVLPQGLGDNEQQPLYPQRYAEVMARNRVLAPGHERSVESLSELRVGPWTAREIGWTE
jgi:hypothetical protein